jgi:hypothetical protein
VADSSFCSAGRLFRLRLASLGLLLLAGCHRGAAVAPAEHHAPAHHPGDYAAAVVRLEELHEEILSGRTRPEGSLDAFAEWEDLVRWLPGLAAETDLAEEPWNRVADISDAWTARIAALRAEPPERRRAVYESQADPWRRALADLTQAAALLDVQATDEHPP